MKKVISTILASLCLITLVSCGNKEEKISKSDKNIESERQIQEIEGEDEKNIKEQWEDGWITLDQVMASGEMTIDEALEINPYVVYEAIESKYIDAIDAIDKGYITEDEVREYGLLPEVVHCKYRRFIMGEDAEEWEKDVNLAETYGEIPDVEYLAELYIGKYVCSIDPNMLENSSIDKIEVDEENQYLSSMDGVLYNKEQTTLIRAPYNFEEKEFTVPSIVISIGKKAFVKSNIQKVNLPDGLKSIGDEAFSECSMLNDMYIPDSVTNIGAMAFLKCYSMRNLRLSESLEYIYESAFNDMPDNSISYKGQIYGPMYMGTLRDKLRQDHVKVR